MFTPKSSLRILSLSAVTLVLAALLGAPPAAAQTTAVQIASSQNIPTKVQGETFLTRTFVDVEAGAGISTVLAGNHDNSVDWGVDDILSISVTHEDGSTGSLDHDFSNGCSGITLVRSLDISGLLRAGRNTATIRFKDACGGNDGNDNLWIVGSGSYQLQDSTPQTSYQYVALGDSFSAGQGALEATYDKATSIPAPDTGATTGCHRSSTAWANSVATAKHLATGQWKFAACSGAVVSDFYNANPDYLPTEREDPQFLWLSQATTLVTFTMGGNDVGFSKVLADCIYDAYSQHGSPGCRKNNRIAHTTAEAGLRQLTAGIPVPGYGNKALADVYLDVAARIAPGATVVVAGYPRLFGEKTTNYPVYEQGAKSCDLGTAVGKVHSAQIPDDLYVSLDDATYVNNVTDRGDQIISDQVTLANTRLTRSGSRTKIVFVQNLDTRFHQHRLCDNGSSYINPLIFHGTHSKPDDRSFHPNSNGQRAYATAVLASLGL